MKKILTFTLLLTALLSQGAVTSVSTTFSTGIPNTFTLKDYSAKSPIAANFSISVKNEWFSAKATPDAGTVAVPAALSCSHRAGTTIPTDNWMILPQVSVNSGTFLSWRAKSIHFNMREDYDVLISTTGTDKENFTLLESVHEEDYFFKNHIIDLSDYSGMDVYLAFAHRSTYKFLLAVTDVKVGTLSSPSLMGTNTGLHFLGADDAGEVSFEVTNYGSTAEIRGFKVVNTDSKSQVGSVSGLQYTLAPGQSVAASVPVEIALNKAYAYQVSAVLSNGSEVTLHSDILNRSTFRKKMAVEKFTGFWCNFCPAVTPAVYRAMTRLGSEMVFLEAHNKGNSSDPLDYSKYFNKMPDDVKYALAGEYPQVWYNRSKELQTIRPYDDENFEAVMKEPATALINVSFEYIQGAPAVSAIASVKFAQDIDNTDNHLRFNFIIAENEVQMPAGSVKQQSRLNGQGEYYGIAHYLGTTWPSPLTWGENVVRGPETSGIGYASSLPNEVLQAGKEYTFSKMVFLPDEAFGDGKYNLVGSIVDTSDPKYKILSIDQKRIQAGTGISDVVAESEIKLCGGSNPVVIFPSDDHYRVEVFGIDGSLMCSKSGIGALCNLADLPASQVLVVRAVQGRNSASFKFVKVK